MVKLLHGDCLELIQTLEPGSIDMVLADPPYGITSNKWDVVIPIKPMWDALRKIVKKETPILLFSQLPFACDLIRENRKSFRYEWIYEKTMATGFLNANKMPLKAHENILVFYDRLPLYNPVFMQGATHKMGRPGGASENYGNYGNTKRRVETMSELYYPRDVVKFKNTTGRGTNHTTEKPVELLEYLIKTYTNEGDTVLDFCMGAGSTGLACRDSGRNFIGIEKNDHYFEVAKGRLQ